MNIFISGGTGFIGKHVTGAMKQAGHSVQTHGFSSGGELRDIPPNADAVINCAGRLGGKGVTREQLLSANVELPVFLGKICRERNIPLVHLSTPGVCGLKPEGSETDPYSPEGDYEETKVLGEKRLLDELPEATILRPDFVFGTGDMHKYPLFRQVSRGWFPLVGKGEALTRPTDARDVALAVMAALPGGVLHRGIYNIGGPEVLSMKELVFSIAGIMGKGLFTVNIPDLAFRAALSLGPLCPGILSRSRYRLFGTHRYVSTARAESAGFRPAKTFAETAADAVEWYRRKGLL